MVRGFQLQIRILSVVVGDIHGQFYDLLGLLTACRTKGDILPNHKFLFLGDYVDRGSFSCEIVLYLYALKICFPDSVFLLRGNHETRQMSDTFNFHCEVLHKYSQEVYEAFMKSFQSLPIAAIVNDEYLCVHGGISPDLHNLSQLYNLDRFVEPPQSGLLCDILWSDPHPEFDTVSKSTGDFLPNSARGCSFYYSHEALCRFLNTNNLSCLIKAHQVQEKGHKMGPINTQSSAKLPSYISIFSAPNYCDMYRNKGAFLQLKNKDINIIEFDASPHPYRLPNFMNLFAWSLPFMCENVSEIFNKLVSRDSK